MIWRPHAAEANEADQLPPAKTARPIFPAVTRVSPTAAALPFKASCVPQSQPPVQFVSHLYDHLITTIPITSRISTYIICMCVCMCMCVYIEREIDRERERLCSLAVVPPAARRRQLTPGEGRSAPKVRAKHYTPEIANVNFHWKMHTFLPVRARAGCVQVFQ